MRDWTPYLVVLILPALGVLDALLYRLGGNDATFSKVMLDARLQHPMVAVATAYSVAVMLGHFFFPVGGPAPPLYEVVARAVVILSPTVAALVVIGANPRSAAGTARAMEAGGPLALAGYMLAAVLIGGLAGAVGLPQHLPPP